MNPKSILLNRPMNAKSIYAKLIYEPIRALLLNQPMNLQEHTALPTGPTNPKTITAQLTCETERALLLNWPMDIQEHYCLTGLWNLNSITAKLTY